MVNVFGKRKDGFANRPFGNVGIQYGLAGLRRGLVTAAQFVDLNTNLGGLDINGDVSPQAQLPRRSVAWSASTAAVRPTGRTTSTRSRSSTCAGPTRAPSTTSTAPTRCAPGCCATSARRPTRCSGAARSAPGDANYARRVDLALDKWLARVDADKRPPRWPRRSSRTSPVMSPTAAPTAPARRYPRRSATRPSRPTARRGFAADEPLTDDVLKCQLGAAQDDTRVTFTDDQWAPGRSSDGVCTAG